VPAHKPRFAYAFATALGVGYLKPAPGTWGSVVGLILAVVSHPLTWFVLISGALESTLGVNAPLLTNPYGLALLLTPSIIVWIVVAFGGAAFLGTHIAGAFGFVWLLICLGCAGFFWGTILRYLLHLLACGHVAVRNGACYKCLNCGESLGCS